MGEAWQEYMENWELHDEQYISADEWNWQHGEDALKTQKEQDWFPYPSNLMLRCHPRVYNKESEGSHNLWPNWEKGYACQVYDRTETDEGELTYTVHVYHEEIDEAVTRHDVNREFIIMIDMPYTTAWHRSEAFRQIIGIPDDIFQMLGET
jgi:hypothetical protein